MRLLMMALAVTAIIVLGVGIDAQSRRGPGQPTEAGIPPDETGIVHAPGRVEGATLEIKLRPQLEGPVEQVLVEEGQYVQSGDLLLRLDDAEFREQVTLASAEHQVAQARLGKLYEGAHPQEREEAAALLRAKEAELTQARLAWNRTHQLREAKAVAQQQADDHRGIVESLTAQVAAAKARLALLESPPRPEEINLEQARIAAANAQWKLAEVQLKRTELRASRDGQVLKIDVEPGELAGPESPRPAIVLADTSRFHVRAFVEEMDAPRIRPGLAAVVEADGLPGVEIPGRVVRVSPRMSAKSLWTGEPAERYDTKVREVELEIDGPRDLVVGLRVDVRIEIESQTPGAK